MNLTGLKVTVIGIARSGLSAALLLKNMGCSVYATDNSVNDEIRNNINILKNEGIDFEIGEHTESFVKNKDLMVVSPAVAKSSPVIEWAKEYGVPIISEIELGYLFCKGKALAVTGTNGKTTTTTLIGKIIEKSGSPIVVCGNIGTPFCSQIPNITSDHYVVLEVSSFQLEWIDKFKPYASIILNVTNNHLDRHADFNEYIDMKKKIFMNQEREDVLILNYDDSNLKDMNGSISPRKIFFSKEREVEGAFVKGKEIFLNIDGRLKVFCRTDEIRLKGLHNLDNVMASILVCKSIGIADDDIKETIYSFEPLPHRFQHIAEIEGIEFINDSKATSVDAASKALLSLEKPVILIGGGRDKGSDFTLIKDIVRKKVRCLILIGEAKEKIAKTMGGIASIRYATTLEEAVGLGYGIAKRGDAVLLSPMCASFDMFKDYIERGEVFIKAVNNLKEKLCAKYEFHS